MCRVVDTYDDCVLMRCDICKFTYAVDREFLEITLTGVWPKHLLDTGVRWV